MTVLSIAIILVLTVISHFVPDWTRPDIFFTVTVDPAFRATETGRAILRRYRILIWTIGMLAAVLQPFLHTIYAADIIPLTGLVLALLDARYQTQRHAAAPNPVVEVELTAPRETLPGWPWTALAPLAALAALALRTHAYLLVSVHAATCVFLLLLAWGVLHWSRRIATAGPPAESERRFRRLCVWLVILSAWYMSAQAWILHLRPPVWVIYASAGAISATILVFVALLARAGQGGSHAAPAAAGGPPVGDRTPDSCWKWGLVYYNPSDPAVFVEKRFGIGYTFNFGSRWTWVLLAVLLLPIAIKLL